MELLFLKCIHMPPNLYALKSTERIDSRVLAGLALGRGIRSFAKKNFFLAPYLSFLLFSPINMYYFCKMRKKEKKKRKKALLRQTEMKPDRFIL